MKPPHRLRFFADSGEPRAPERRGGTGPPEGRRLRKADLAAERGHRWAADRLCWWPLAGARRRSEARRPAGSRRARSEATMVEEIEATVRRITAERERFERFCRSLSAEELQRPVPCSSWIVKDFISHLATIDGPIAAWFAAIADGSGTRSGGQSGRGAWDV